VRDKTPKELVRLWSLAALWGELFYRQAGDFLHVGGIGDQSLQERLAIELGMELRAVDWSIRELESLVSYAIRRCQERRIRR
jgi:hypothetical protein